MDSQDKSALRPTRLERIYDVVQAAGIDVSAWHKGKGDYASNPSFCYRWAFEGETTALLCLWLDTIHWVDGAWVCTGNARQEQMEREAAGSDHWDQAVRNRTKRWANSALQMDEVIKQAFRKKLEVRVCIVDTKARASDLEASSADRRSLDPRPWSLQYDMMTGHYEVRREALSVIERPPVALEESVGELAATSGTPDQPSLPEITETSYGVGVVDQFVVDEHLRDPVLTERYERERSAVVRQLVMARSEGKCEWCDKLGFLKHDGQIYLESHHVVPLSEGGADSIQNVIALCPNDHRMAHYADGRESLVDKMLVRIAERNEAGILPDALKAIP
jgi:hypothetical protein